MASKLAKMPFLALFDPPLYPKGVKIKKKEIYRFVGYLIINLLVGLEFFVGVEKILFFAFSALVSISVIRDIVSYNRNRH